MESFIGHPSVGLLSPSDRCTGTGGHKQSNAQDAVQNLRLALSEHFLGASFWLDIEQDATVSPYLDLFGIHQIYAVVAACMVLGFISILFNILNVSIVFPKDHLQN